MPTVMVLFSCNQVFCLGVRLNLLLLICAEAELSISRVNNNKKKGIARFNDDDKFTGINCNVFVFRRSVGKICQKFFTINGFKQKSANTQLLQST